MSKMDEIFKNKLAHTSDPTPHHIWDAIEQELERESKRPIFWYVLTLGFLLLSILLAGLFIVGNQTDESAVASHNVQLGEKNITHYISTTTNASAGVNSSSEMSIKSQSADDNNSLAVAEVISDPITSNQATSNNEKGNEYFIAKEAVSSTPIHPSLSNSSSFSISDNDGMANDSEINNDKEIKWKIESTDKVKVNKISAPEIMKTKTFNRRRELYRFPVEIASGYEIQQINSSVNRLDRMAGMNVVMYTECPSFSKDRTGVYADFYMSHDLPNQSLTPSSSLVDIREKSESSAYSYAIGGRISLSLPSGFSLRTGLHYSQINQQLVYSDEGNVEIQSNNSHKFFDLPLLLGYEFGQEGSRFYYAANAGINLNVNYTQSGAFLDGEMSLRDFTDYDDSGKNAYKDAAGLSYMGSFAIYYRAFQNIDLYLEPNIRWMPGSLNSEINPIDETFNTIGIMTGLRYRL